MGMEVEILIGGISSTLPARALYNLITLYKPRSDRFTMVLGEQYEQH